MLVPAIASIGTCCSSSTFKTPICAIPRAPPPERTRPIRGLCAGAGVEGDAVSETFCPEAAVAAASQKMAQRTPNTPRRGLTARGEITRQEYQQAAMELDPRDDLYAADAAYDLSVCAFLSRFGVFW